MSEEEWITQAAKREDGAMVNAGKPTCYHVWGIDGMHSNEFCKKCFVSRSDLEGRDE